MTEQPRPEERRPEDPGPEDPQPEDIVNLNPMFRLQWEEAQDAHVLLYPEGMVQLNDAAAEILRHCDGVRTVADIVGKLGEEFPEEDLAADVHEFLQSALTNGWIRIAKD